MHPVKARRKIAQVRGEKKRSGRRKVTAPEFGLKEVGSLFIYIVAAAPPFFDKFPEKS
jgi:hypothetical protein